MVQCLRCTQLGAFYRSALRSSVFVPVRKSWLAVCSLSMLIRMSLTIVQGLKYISAKTVPSAHVHVWEIAEAAVHVFTRCRGRAVVAVAVFTGRSLGSSCVSRTSEHIAGREE